jgi:hypothetical protein
MQIKPVHYISLMHRCPKKFKSKRNPPTYISTKLRVCPIKIKLHLIISVLIRWCFQFSSSIIVVAMKKPTTFSFRKKGGCKEHQTVLTSLQMCWHQTSFFNSTHWMNYMIASIQLFQQKYIYL